MPETPGPRFLKLADVAEELDMSENQIYALVRRGDIEAVKIGGRGQWRVERVKFEEYIARTYEETRQFIKDNPLTQDVDQAAEPVAQSESTASADRADLAGRGQDDVAALAAMANPLPPSAAVSAGTRAAGAQPAGGGVDDRGTGGLEL